MKKKYIASTIIFFLIIFIFLSLNKFNKTETKKIKPENSDEIPYSNIIENVYYSSKDARGNEYIIEADKGEIDYNNTDTIYLTKVRGFIKLTNSNDIKVTSEYGKYNTNNFDTIFSKNVIIEYLNNNISGGYLDFSIERGSMIVSKNVVYNNLNNILKADVFNIDINTKDAKIFMLENNKKVNIKDKQ
tara:strand:- start:134 stop:697 length:564 start_codon:yes stop_codon:yes gene_type:complete